MSSPLQNVVQIATSLSYVVNTSSVSCTVFQHTFSSVQIALIHHTLSSRNVPRICCFLSAKRSTTWQFFLGYTPHMLFLSGKMRTTCSLLPVQYIQPAPTTATCDDYAIFYLQNRPEYVVSFAKHLSTCNFVLQYALNTTSLLLLNIQFLQCKIPPACIRCRNRRRLAATVIQMERRFS